MTITLIYKNIISCLLRKVEKWQCEERERERERESGTVKIYPRLRYDISREPYFFTLPPQG